MLESVQSRLMKAMLRVIRLKKMWELTGEELRKTIEKKQACESHEPPPRFQNSFSVSQRMVNGCCCYTIQPRNGVGTKHILYLHGGGYVYEIMSLHWEFIGKLIASLHCKVTVPIYPLAPRHSCQDVFDMLVPVYRQIVMDTNPQDIVIMGDSTGAGLGLSLAQHLKEIDLPQPGNIILITPTLDATFSNPEIHAVEPLDPVSAVPALRDIVEWYRGEKGAMHYLVSPMYGDLEGLGKISLFIGTHDILYPDAKKFKKMAEEKGIEIGYFEYPSMIHIWPLHFFPESQKATQQMMQIIKQS